MAINSLAICRRLPNGGADAIGLTEFDGGWLAAKQYAANGRPYRPLRFLMDPEQPAPRVEQPTKEHGSMFFSYSLIMGVIVHVACQIFKLIFYSIRDKRVGLHYLLSAGGMPSTHSAFTTTVSLSLGLTRGFDSEYFAIAAALTAVVIYDSLRLRGAVQTHSDLLLKLSTALPKAEREKIPRMVGHTFGEIVAGIAIALAASVGGYLIKTAAGFS